MFRRPSFPTSMAFLLCFFVAAGASAIFLPCDDVCQQGAPNAKNCSYFGEGSCPAYPNPCYMSCATYRSCTGSPAQDENATAGSAAASQGSHLPMAAGTEAWVDFLAVGFYGPCLFPFGGEGEERVETASPTLQSLTKTQIGSPGVRILSEEAPLSIQAAPVDRK